MLAEAALLAIMTGNTMSSVLILVSLVLKLTTSISAKMSVAGTTNLFPV